MASAATHFSPHFRIAEFNCHDGTPVPQGCHRYYRNLCHDFLEPLRASYGPVRVVSGFRTISHNRAVGGAPHSYHVCRASRHGAAADVVCHQGSPAEWHRLLDGLGAKGLGLYPNWVHVDNRATTARW